MTVRNTKLSRKRKTPRKIRSRKLTGGRRKKSVRSKRLRKRALSGGRKIRSARKRVRRSSKQIGGTSQKEQEKRIRELQGIIDIINNKLNGLIPIATFMAAEDKDRADMYYNIYISMNIISKTDFEGPDRITILDNLVEYLTQLNKKYEYAYHNITLCNGCLKPGSNHLTDQSITNQKIFEKTQQVLKISTDGNEPSPSLSYKVRNNTPYPKVLKDTTDGCGRCLGGFRAELKQPHLKGYHPEFTDIKFLTELLEHWPPGKQIPTL